MATERLVVEQDHGAFAVLVFGQESDAGNMILLRDFIGILVESYANSFQSAIYRCERPAGETDDVATRSLLRAAWAWLPAGRVCRIVDGMMRRLERAQDRALKGGLSYVAGGRQLREQLFEYLEEMGGDWHQCPDRRWPCDEGRQCQPAAVQWFQWGLLSGLDDANGPDLDDARESSLKALEHALRHPLESARLDTLLDKAVLREILQSDEIDAAVAGELGGQATTESARKQFATFVVALLHDIPHTPESVESVIRGVSSYAVNVWGVDPRLQLASHMRHGARGEPSLHMLREFYRDHFFHTLEVCFLGHVLTRARARGKPGDSIGVERPAFLRDWYVASLLHDMGYGVDIAKGLEDWLGFFARGPLVALEGGMKSSLSSAGKRKEFAEFCSSQKLADELKPWEDHGVLAGYHLQTLAERAGKRGKIHGVKRSVRAISVHNCQQVGISYKEERLSALLILSDTLQAWRRPHFLHYSMGPAWMMAAMSGGRPEPSPADGSARLLSNLKFVKRGNDVRPVFAEPLVLRLEYGPEVLRDSCVFNIWLDATCNLQRVDWSGLPYDVIVQIVTPAYQGERQRDRLREAADETHMAYLADWLAAKEHEGIPAVDGGKPDACCRRSRLCYHVELEEPEAAGVGTAGAGGDDGDADEADDGDTPPVVRREMISLNLKKFDGRTRLVKDTMSRFRDDLKRWRSYGDDRGVWGDYAEYRVPRE